MTEPTEPGAPRQIATAPARPAWLVTERPPCTHVDADGPCQSLITTRASRAAGDPRCWCHSPEDQVSAEAKLAFRLKGQAVRLTRQAMNGRASVPPTLPATQPADPRVDALRDPVREAATGRLERYLAQRCGPRTAYQNRRKWVRFVAFQATCPDRPLVEQAQAWLATIPVSQQAAALPVLKIALGAAACDWSEVVVKRYRRDEIRLARSVLKEADRARVRAAARGPRELAILETLWTLRRHEVAALCWGDLDLPQGLVYVKHGKGNKPAWTLLPPSTRAALAAWRADAGEPPAAAPVFPIPRETGHPRHVGGAYSPNGLGKLVRRILLRAGLWAPGAGCSHRFRRSFASTYIKANPQDLSGLMKLMRHTQLSTTGKYLFYEPEDLAPRMAALEL